MERGYDVYTSSLLGEIYMVVGESGVEAIYLLKEHFEAACKQEPELTRNEALCQETKKQLQEYFEGTRKQFSLPVNLQGTAFRMKVWHALKTIAYGQTLSYKQLAEKIGQPNAVRAVGGANGANPIPIIIPCHRVIGVRGKMVGYMGCHTDIKEKLLAHEQKVLEWGNRSEGI